MRKIAGGFRRGFELARLRLYILYSLVQFISGLDT